MRSASTPCLHSLLDRRNPSKGSACSTPTFEWVRAKSIAGLTEANLDERSRVPLTDVELQTIRTLPHPPLVLRRLLEAVYWILAAPRLAGRPPRKDTLTWERVLRLVNSPGFCEAIWHYSSASLRASPLVIEHLRSYYFGKGALSGSLRAAAVRRASSSAVSLYDWAFRVLEEAECESRAASPLAASEKSSRRTPSPEKSSTRASSPVASIVEHLSEPAEIPPPPPPPLPISRLVVSKSETILKPLVLTPCKSLVVSKSETILKPLVLTPCKSAPLLLRPAPQPPPPKVILVIAGACRKASLIIVKKLLDQAREQTVVLAVHGQMECVTARMDMRTVLTDSADRVTVEQLDVDQPRSTWECARQIKARYSKFSALVIDAKSFRDVRGIRSPCNGLPASREASMVASLFDTFCHYLAPDAHVSILSSQLGVAATQQMSDAQRTSLLPRQGLSVEDVLQLAERPVGSSWNGVDTEGLGFTLLHALTLALHHRNPGLCIYAVACMTGRNLDAEEATAIATVMAKPTAGLGGRLFGNNGAPVPWVADAYYRVAWSDTSSALKRAGSNCLR